MDRRFSLAKLSRVPGYENAGLNYSLELANVLWMRPMVVRYIYAWRECMCASEFPYCIRIQQLNIMLVHLKCSHHNAAAHLPSQSQLKYSTATIFYRKRNAHHQIRELAKFSNQFGCYLLLFFIFIFSLAPLSVSSVEMFFNSSVE